MTDEEKEAIEYFKSNLEMTKEMGKKWGFQEEIKNNEIILNLINKQSKEVQELKEENKELSDKLTQKICKGVEEEILEEYRQIIIDKDKLIEELKNGNIDFWMGDKEIEERIRNKFVSKDKIKANRQKDAKE